MAVDLPEELPRRVREFQACEACSYDFVTGEGDRSCHYYECPYLPEQLDIKCPTCLYNFATEEGQPACGNEPDCEFALTIAPERLRILARWLELRGDVVVTDA